MEKSYKKKEKKNKKKNRERVFEKTEADVEKDIKEIKRRQYNKKVYGVETFESEEEIQEEKKDLKQIQEADEDMERSDYSGEIIDLENLDKEIEQPKKQIKKYVTEKLDQNKPLAYIKQEQKEQVKINKQELMEDEDFLRLQRIRAERKRAEKEKEFEKKKLKELAEKEKKALLEKYSKKGQKKGKKKGKKKKQFNYNLLWVIKHLKLLKKQLIIHLVRLNNQQISQRIIQYLKKPRQEPTIQNII